MKQELDQLLCERYPKMFVERHLSEMETCMCWGFAHGEGWFNIIDQLCANIQHHIDWKNRETEIVPQVVVEQVKEKFGTLRFYYRGGDDYISGLVSMAESMSGVTCEECGAPGATGGQGWISTLCETHRNKNG
jgi:hypothetical protein